MFGSGLHIDHGIEYISTLLSSAIGPCCDFAALLWEVISALSAFALSHLSQSAN